MKEVMRIDVEIDQIHELRGESASVTMILFHGTFSCEAGSGVILPGGADLQIEKRGECRTLSARYILEGRDGEGRTFHIFVENNGHCTEGPLTAYPVIYTDCKELQWMEKEALVSSVESAGEDKVLIRMYCGQ